MKPTHKRLILAGDNSLRVQGDFGGGYTIWFGNDPGARRAAIVNALIYMPGATLIDATSDAEAELGALSISLKS